MEKKNEVYAGHILDAIQRIEKYMSGISREKFLHQTNNMMQAAVVRELEIIGEAAKHFSREFRENHPNIPWDDITGMRDKIVHDYFSIDLIVVWEVTQEDLLPLQKELQIKGA